MNTNKRTILLQRLLAATIPLLAAAGSASTALAQANYEPYAISTLAGSPGVVGSADGAGSAARFNFPNNVAVDGAGNVYVADRNNDTIRKITSGGVVTTLAGSPGVVGSADGAGSAARFNNPRGVAADDAGNIYVADTSNQTIRKITPGGSVSTMAGLAGASGSADGIGSDARFYNPFGIAVDSAGNLYVADWFNYTIRKITSEGAVTTLAGMAGVTGSEDGMGSTARFYFPSGVAVDGAFNVYVADSDNQTIRKITPGAVVSTLAGLAGASGSADGAGSAARFSFPAGVAVDDDGSIYVADTNNDTIRKVTPAGSVTTLAGLAGASGSADGAGSAARFDFPTGVAISSAGYVYVADRDNQTVRAGVPAFALATAASRKLHGAAGTFDVNLPLSGSPGIECRTGGAGGDHTLVITFSNTVVSGNAAVTSGTGSVAGAPAFSNNTMTINLTAIANAQTITVTLSNVTDSFSQMLPDTALGASFLRGDTSANGSVNASDVSQTKLQSGQAVTNANFREDVNANGSINATDVSSVKLQSGTALP